LQILQFVIDGLLLGGVYAAVGVGFALVWGIMNIINLAHGAMIMLGAYVTFWLFKLAGVDPFASIPVAMAMLFILGWLIQRYLINYVVRAPMLITFLMTFGLELLIVDLSLNFFSADNRSVQTFYSGARLDLGGLAIPLVHLYTLMVALVLVTLLQLFLVRTRIGNAIQATSMDLDAARLGSNVVADGWLERDGLRDSCQAQLAAAHALTQAERERAERAETQLETERTDRRTLTSHLTSTASDNSPQPGPQPRGGARSK